MIGQAWANRQYFNPKQIGGLVLWLDATDPAANGIVPVDGTAIGTWTDKSTKGNSFTQGTVGLKPLLKANIFGSLPGILGDGSSQYMSCSTSNGFPTGSNGRALFTVIKTAALNADLNYITSLGTYAATEAMDPVIDCRSTNPGPLLVDWNGTSSDTSSSLGNTTKYRYSINFASGATFGTINMIINDVTQSVTGTGAHPNSVAGTNFLFVRQGLIQYFAGYIAEILYYNVNLTAAQISIVSNYLKNKWGI